MTREMSSRAGSNKKQKVLLGEPSDTLFDPFFGFKPKESFSDIPWPEWNDADLNAEVWGETKFRPTTEDKRSAGTGLNVSRSFEDPIPLLLPNEIKDYVGSWKRPQEVFPNAVLTVYDPENLWFKLKVPSPVSECNILNCFNNILPILQYYGEKYKIPIEMESSTFTVSNPLEAWRPWHHIYALNKAGKGSIHKPLFNSYGKYVLRLFYFGSWRKFIIDDKIPCDKYGNCMLPVTQVEGELWPLLLVKGLLKIISLTPSCDMSVIDFPLISCLTAWIGIKLTTLNKSYEEVWRRLLLLSPQFFLPEEKIEENLKKTPAIIDSTKSKTPKEVQLSKTNSQDEYFCFLFATLGGFALDSSELNGQFVMVTMNRNIPLVKADKKEPTKPWKRFRWVDWALEKGIWVDELLLSPYRRLLYITFNEKLPAFFAPDPIQESTMYNLPNEYVSNEEIHQPLVEENGMPNTEHWMDYNKFYEYLTILDVLFKPSCFTSNYKITYLTPLVSSKTKGSAISGTIAAKALPQNLYVYSPFLTPTFNQPPLLLCQCVTECFLCISLWVYPQKEKLSMGYLDPEQPELLKVGHASLILEDYDWRNVVQGKILGVLKTVGNSSLYLNLEPGRHILKLWLKSDSPYILNIFSSVDIFVQKGPKIRFYMANESKRILSYVWNISDAFIELVQNFGKQEYREILHKFYKALKSGTSSSVNRSEDDFIELFLDSIMLQLNKLITNYEELKIMLGALRSLFLNLRIKCDFLKKAPASTYSTSTKKTLKKGGKGDHTLKERTLSQIIRHPWTPKEIQQIIMIQRIFRGYRMRLLLKCQTPIRKEYKHYTEKLKKICDLIFSPSKREAEVGKIIREIIKINPNFCNIFKFRKDFSKVLHIDDYTGKVPNVEAYAWVPLVRFTVALHSDEPEPCAFYFHCNLEQHFLVGVNNDTDEEIFLLTNTLSPHYYHRNVNGYTIFGYGWNGSNPKTVYWRLEIVTMKWFQGVHLCNTLLGPECHSYTLPILEMIELKNFYVPNRLFKICRCFIIVRKKCILTLRFTTSYSKAKFHLIIFIEKKTKTHIQEQRHSLQFKSRTRHKSSIASIVSESFSENGAVLIPSLILDNIETEVSGEAGEGENFTKYILEAYVIGNSWPLTKHEWGTIEPIRINGELTNQSTTFPTLKKERSESKRKTSRLSKRSLLSEKNVENPFWHLQIVNSLEDGENDYNLIAGEEKLFSESMKAMKKFWEENDPGRRNRGREMRLKFLNSIYLENKNKQKSKVQDSTETKNYHHSTPSLTNSNENFFEDMIHKMNSFSYLLNSKSPTRYSESPKVLPEMPTKKLLKQYRRKEKHESLKVDEMSIYEEIEENIESEIEEKEREFWDERIHYRQVMMNHFIDEQKLSEQLMEEAYKQRLKAIEKMAR